MKKKHLIIISLVLFGFSLSAQADKEAKTPVLEFDTIASVKTTAVKDQHRSGTCWSFAATSFIETELIRKGKEHYDLSEMFFVRYAYEEKAENYVRLHGKANFSPGGQAHDVIDVVREHGMLTEKAYPGMIQGQELPNHSELDKVLRGFVDGVLAAKGRGTTEVWFDAYQAMLDVYLGEVPEKTTMNGKTVKTKDVPELLDFNPDDYVEITSYNHQDYYSSFRLEIPDNWDYADYYNVPLNELMSIMDNAFAKGYSVCWDGDVSSKHFDHKNRALAVLPEKDDFNMEEFTAGTPEKEVDQDMRQEYFANFTATDDHLMHLTAVIKDESGRKYYVTKNSWATDSNENGGYLNMSESYVRLNTVAIMVHKDAIPDEIRKKLGI